ncbi:alpha/beta hydrolase [Aestuariivirga sp.]|uniref:alpha/beta hydrolase n=1 Tax=Aestuariivirga sp. TaxID=2650926 RepID=UPI003BABB7A4
MSKFGVSLLHRFTAPLSAAGLVAGALFWLAALTPSLIPRNGLLQGAIAGLCFAVGYGLAAGVAQLWVWLGLPAPGTGPLHWLRRVAAVAAGVIVIAAAFFAGGWQNDVTKALGLPSVPAGWPFVLLAVGVALFIVLLMIGRFFGALRELYLLPMRRLLPMRAAILLASVLALWSFWAIGNGVLLQALLRGLDSAYRTVDAVIPADEAPPKDPLKTGSAASLLSWEELGREGRRRVLAAPDAAQITGITGKPAAEPLRIYVGLNSARTPEERAALALAEMERVGAFSRKLLVIATPTGTGWVDEAAMMPLEVMQGGDLASVSVQYSYLPSWLTLFVDPVYGEDTARAVFDAIYGHWRSLPKDSRPRLFLFGLSLGSLNSDLASDAFALLGDPFEGAFWTGPPFASRTWPQVTATRQQGSPAWLPVARNNSVFRFFTAQDQSQLQQPGWGPVKVLYLQYPSDPITFFKTDMWRREPDWMKSPRGPDVSPALTWMPAISFIQLAFDLMTATTVPKGRGHVFAAKDYAAGWQAITQPEGFGEAEMKKLEVWLDGLGL